MDMKIDGELLKTVMQEALMRQLKDIDREALIAAALAHLMKDERNAYGDRKSPLERAFNDAAEFVTRDIIKEEFAKPELRARFTALVVALMEKVLSDPYDKIIPALAGSFAEAIRHKER